MKKNHNKNKLNMLIKIIFFSICLTFPNFATYAKDTNVCIEHSLSSVERTEDIRWTFKKVDGKLYKRLYNYTRKEWIGEWELVG